MELTKALIHDFYRRVAEHRLEVLAPKGSKKRLLQEEEFALFHRFMSGDLSEEEKGVEAEADEEARALLESKTRKR